MVRRDEPQHTEVIKDESESHNEVHEVDLTHATHEGISIALDSNKDNVHFDDKSLEDILVDQSQVPHQVETDHQEEVKVVEMCEVQQEVLNYDFVFSDIELMEPPRIIGIHMKHHLYFSMEMVSFIQVQGGWIEEYLVDNTSLVEQGNGTTFIKPQFLSNTFVPYLPRELRTYITVIHVPSSNLIPMSCVVICFDSKIFYSCGYTSLFWLMGMMLTRKMLVDETTRDRIAYAYLNQLSFVYFYAFSLCFISYYVTNSNPMLASSLFCFLGLPCLLNVDYDLRTNPLEGGWDDEQPPSHNITIHMITTRNSRKATMQANSSHLQKGHFGGNQCKQPRWTHHGLHCSLRITRPPSSYHKTSQQASLHGQSRDHPKGSKTYKCWKITADEPTLIIHHGQLQNPLTLCHIWMESFGCLVTAEFYGL